MNMQSEMTSDFKATTPGATRRRVGRLKAVLVGMLIVGAVTAYAGGTFANFSAQTNNPATIQTGTLVLDNKAPTTDCYSTNGGTGTTVNTANSATCASYFSVSTGSTGTGTQNLTLTDIGTLGASTSALTIVCTTSAAAGTFTGTGDLCAGLKIIVAETDNTFSTLKTSATALVGTCSGATVSTCSGAAGPTGNGVATVTANPGAFAATTARYFYISVGLGGTTDNALQGRSAAMTFKWAATE